MYPSIFSNVITGTDPHRAAARTRELGLASVQFTPAEVSVGFGFDTDVTGGDFAAWKAAYDTEGIGICAVAGYLNLLHHDLTIRRRNIDTFTGYLRRMHLLGTQLISVETGSLAPTGDWDDDPTNHTPQAMADLEAVLAELVAVAEAEDVVVLIEPYVVNVCDTPQLGADLVRRFSSPHLGICMDPTNFFSTALARPELVGQVIRDGFAAERPYFRLAHAKDVVPTAPGEAVPGLPGPGQGILDYPLYLDLLADAGYEGALVIEHLTEAEVPAALEFVTGQLTGLAERRSLCS
ncbi:sugar phosphate isomerase/epimerase family protein [Nakamurella alba]|uniref:sugar phosphate isomerase/epimerase family protein n=1 Tax=Nakamurella alba TaxID=2665158 RepID=UPI0018ABE770|nr:sugar phosphate isomerase/epimerase family protein [Nakamurella alba]